ncbi:MAG: hypothetical protein WBG44_08830, partial [Comamonas sp.]
MEFSGFCACPICASSYINYSTRHHSAIRRRGAGAKKAILSFRPDAALTLRACPRRREGAARQPGAQLG